MREKPPLRGSSGNCFHFGKSSNAFNAFNAGTSGSPHAALDALTLRHHQRAHRYLLRFPGFHLRHIGAPVPHASAASESADRHQILRHRRRVLREECPPVRGECRVQAPPEVTGGGCAPRARRGGFVPGASVPNAPNFLRRVIASGTGSESAFFLRNCAKNEQTAPNLHRIRYSCTEFFCNSVQQNRLKRLLNSMAYE